METGDGLYFVNVKQIIRKAVFELLKRIDAIISLPGIWLVKM